MTSVEADQKTATQYLEHLAAAIRIPTVSREDGFDPVVFDEMRRFLETTYPRVHAVLKREVVAGYTLFYTWTGTDPDTAPLLLMAHQDVVPVEAGTDGDWEQAAFSGAIADGHLWGRGAIDDKGSLIGILEAVEGLLEDNFVPGATVHLLFGHDEEVGGIRGAAEVAARLTAQGHRLGLVVDEGGAVVSGLFPGVGPLALIGIGEKASLDVEITAFSDGGHSSIPPASSAVGRLAKAVSAIEDHPLPARLDVQRPFLNVLAAAMGGVRGAMLRNLAVTGRLVERMLSRAPHTNALIRTTSAATIIRGGVKSNVLPQEASAIVNFRILPGDTSAGVLNHVRALVGGDLRVLAVDYGQGSDPGALTPIDGSGFRHVAATATATFPDATVAPWILTAATDARYFAPIADAVCRFAPLTTSLADLGRIHGTGERMAVADAAGAVAFFRRLISDYRGRN